MNIAFDIAARKPTEVKLLIDLAVESGVPNDANLFYDMVCLVYCGALPEMAVDFEEEKTGTQ